MARVIALVDADLAADLQSVLEAALAAKRHQCELIDPEVGDAAGVLADFVLHGGKRLRPTFAWWGWRGVPRDRAAGPTPGSGVPNADAVLGAVAALELVHAGALLHDDVLDGSTTRRGRPTVHVRLAGEHRDAGWHGNPERYGHAAAILLGDLALAWAEDLLRDAGLPTGALRRVGPVWAAMRTEVLAGQFLDVRAQASGDESERSALRVALFKSAMYTVARPLQFGGALAGASEELMDAYHRFGADLGVAFQLRDDLLGVFGDPAETGKPAGDDLREGKRTLLVALALTEADRTGAAAAGRAIRTALGRAELTGDELDRARTALVELGAVRAIEDRIADLTESAMTTLDAAPLAPAAATRLAELAVAATVRRA
jgi:geranylgeranyl diphosphate synthase, type I